MQVTFRKALGVYTLLVVALVTIGTSFYSVRSGRQRSIKAFDRRCKLACHITATSLAGDLQAGRRQEFERNLRRVLDTDSSMLFLGAFSRDGGDRLAHFGESRFGDAFANAVECSPEPGSLRSRYDGDQLRVVGPIVDEQGRFLAFMVADFSLNEVFAHQWALTRSAVALTALFIGIGGLLAILLSWKVTKPIMEMTEAARAISKRDFSVRVKSTRQLELNTLGNTLNSMAKELKETTVSREYLSSVLDSMYDGLLVVEETGKIVTANPSASRLTGRSPQQLVDLHVGDVLKKTNYEPYDAMDLLIDQLPEGVDGYVENLEAAHTPVSISFVPVLDNGAARRYVVVMNDITIRKRTEDALDKAIREARQASRVKSEFLANMSHELRTPMNSIIGFTKRLIKKLRDSLSEQNLDALLTVDRNAKHLLGLINDILDLSKIEAGRMELKRSDFDFRVVAMDVVKQTEALVDGRPLRVVLDMPEEEVPVSADRVKVMQVVTNLVSNAIKYSERGLVTVALRSEQDLDGRQVARLAVRDTGAGIKEEDLDRLFKKFSQLDNSSTRPVGGTGLGLFITAQYVEMHGGHIKVESVYGEGSTFTATFPVEAEAGKTPRPATEVEPAEEPAAAPKILCVDDDLDSLKLVQLTFAEAGFEVLKASCVDEAVALAKRQNPEVICTDIKMPGKDGYDLAKELAADERTREIPLIVVSSASDEAKNAGMKAQHFLAKPIDHGELMCAVQQCLAQQVESVLVVEDDPSAALMISHTFNEQGIETHIANNGVEAIVHLGQRTPTAVVLDLMMPVMDGFEFLRRVRGTPQWSNLPVVVLSSATLSGEDERRLAKLSDAFFDKSQYSASRVVLAIVSASKTRGAIAKQEAPV